MMKIGVVTTRNGKVKTVSESDFSSSHNIVKMFFFTSVINNPNKNRAGPRRQAGAGAEIQWVRPTLSSGQL